MNRPIPLLVLATATLLALSPALRAQSAGAASAAAAAYDTFSSGDYKSAATAYEQLLKNYPTDGVIPGAQIQLAYVYFYLGQYDQAQAMLAKAMSGPPLPPEAKQSVEGFIPQILLAKANSLPANNPQRQTALQDAVTKFTAFITAYPQAPDLETAILNRGIAEFQLQKYADAQKDFELNIQKFPQSSTIATSKNLLALTLAAEGSLDLAKKDPTSTAEAFALYKRAGDLLRDIIAKKQDVTLLNEAWYRLGEILFSQAQFSPEANRPALYQQALEAYRNVVPVEQIVALEQQILKEFPERKRQALLAKNDALRKQLDKDNERELRKLAELQGRPDPVPNALLKMAEIFYQQNKTNEARVILQHVDSSLKEDDDKKRALYLQTMSYALQNVADKAATKYSDFQSKYKGDPTADNLPLTMGTMYLGLNNLPESIRYLNESITLYPNGRFIGLSVVNKAQAESKTGKYDEAQQTFKDYLAKNPPPEVGVVAQFGLAGTYKDTKKWDDAIAAYKVVKDKYPSTPQAVESDYWIGTATQQKGDNAAAIPILDAYAKANPQSPLAPIAVYTKGAAQIALGQKEDGITSMAQVADQYPESLPAPFTYFTRAQIRGGEGKADEVVALMKKFIEKYPQDNKVYPAYDTIAQTAINGGNVDAGVAAYKEFVDKYPQSPQAAEALLKVADVQRTKAEALGRYGALNDQEKATWKTLMDGSVASLEALLKGYPDSPVVPQALQTLLQDQRLLVAGELKKDADVQPYFQALADAAPNPAAKSKILFTLATYVADKDPAKALAIMNLAYQADIIYAPDSLDYYGQALVTQKKLPEAEAVFEKLARDYPNPAGVAPTAAPLAVQQAQAISLFGRGTVAQAQGQTADAGKFFEQLKALYSWSPKVLEANYGIAQSLKAQGKADEALALLAGVVRAPNATASLRANSMLLGGYLMLEKQKTATDPKQQADYLGAAIDYFIKIPQFYASEQLQSAEGLWEGSQLLEQQANASTDPKFKTQQLGRARSFYQQLVKDYPTSEYVAKAQDRLTALGPQ